MEFLQECWCRHRCFSRHVFLLLPFFFFLIHRHEDGTVRFWDASGVALTPLYKLSTANVFHTDCDPCDDPPDPNDDPDMQQEEEWPPFRKVRSQQEKMNENYQPAPIIFPPAASCLSFLLSVCKETCCTLIHFLDQWTQTCICAAIFADKRPKLVIWNPVNQSG